MFRLRILVFVGCALAVTVLGADAQDTDLKAVLRKSIAAHGGEKNLAKFKGVTSKFKGTMEIMGIKADVTGETSMQKPDKVKNVMTLNLNGKSIDIVTVFNGEKLWVAVMGQTKEIDDEKVLKAAREEMQAESAGSLADFLKAPYQLSAIGDVKVKGKDAIGIRVSKKDQKDISMFFDKKTYLVVKTEMRTLDAMTGQEVTQEKFILGYQEKNGMKIAKHVEIVKDGKLFMDLEITDVQVFDKHNDAIFAKP
jgi:hypothetical protein